MIVKGSQLCDEGEKDLNVKKDLLDIEHLYRF